jgi:RNA polymerase sigma-70 factor (ECF subfamily)
MFDGHFRSIYAYAIRRVGSGHDAGDVAAEVFATAWRRIDEVPDPPEDLLWLYGVARRTVAQHWRSAGRRGRLVDRLKLVRIPQPDLPPSDDAIYDDLFEAMGRLRPDDREALQLVLWEHLSHAEAALVLECSKNAVAIRVHRAKARLRAELNSQTDSRDVPDIESDPANPTRS